MEILYTASAHAVGGRNGHVETSDGLLNLNLTIPKSMAGPGKSGSTNPEQLFACGYAACFGSAIEFVAKQQGVELKEIHVVADVSIGRVPDGFGLSAVLKICLPGLDRDAAMKIANAAHQVCPYSKATRNNMAVTLQVVDKI